MVRSVRAALTVPACLFFAANQLKQGVDLHELDPRRAVDFLFRNPFEHRFHHSVSNVCLYSGRGSVTALLALLAARKSTPHASTPIPPSALPFKHERAFRISSHNRGVSNAVHFHTPRVRWRTDAPPRS